MPAISVNRLRNGFGQAWPRRLRVLAVVALTLAVAGPAIVALEGWEIDAASLIGPISASWGSYSDNPPPNTAVRRPDLCFRPAAPMHMPSVQSRESKMPMSVAGRQILSQPSTSWVWARWVLLAAFVVAVGVATVAMLGWDSAIARADQASALAFAARSQAD